MGFREEAGHTSVRESLTGREAGDAYEGALSIR